MIILGIETSCDDTSCAVLKDGQEVLSNIVSSQEEVHQKFGGIVPELAARRHINIIELAAEEALKKANVSKIDAIAVTNGPGLPGALLVGLSFAAGLGYRKKIPVITVNHLEGHILSAFLDNPVKPEGNYIALVISGGHSNIYFCRNTGDYKLIGKTIDDAAGEALDKAAKMLGLGYPGGPVIDKLAQNGDPKKYKFPRPMYKKDTYELSYSGLKTALYLFLKEKKGDYRLEDVCASYQEAVIDCIIEKTKKAVNEYNVGRLVIGGGVSANSLLRKRISGTFKGMEILLPQIKYCGDNGAMIALAAYHKLRSGQKVTADLSPYPSAVL